MKRFSACGGSFFIRFKKLRMRKEKRNGLFSCDKSIKNCNMLKIKIFYSVILSIKIFFIHLHTQFKEEVRLFQK